MEHERRQKNESASVRNNLLKMTKNNQLICATLSLIRRIEELWSELNLVWIKILKNEDYTAPGM